MLTCVFLLEKNICLYILAIAKSNVGYNGEGTKKNLQQLVANSRTECHKALLSEIKQLTQVPWGHHCIIIDKCKRDVDKALFYVRKTIENGWSRNVLAIEIDGDLYSRQGKAVTNFDLTMPKPDSDLAQQLTKDPYIFDVQGLAEQYRETELTKAMWRISSNC